MATTPSGADVDADTLTFAEELAAMMVAQGFDDYEEIVESVYESAEPGTGLTSELAESIVLQRWRARLAEQDDWPDTTDCDRLDAAFDALRDAGLTAAHDFACCLGCGLAEIGGVAADGDRGWVFYHEQDTENAVEGGGLFLAFGSHTGGGEAAVAIGREVVARLGAAGLGVSWNGDSDTRIHVTPLDWRRRLPGDGSESGQD